MCPTGRSAGPHSGRRTGSVQLGTRGSSGSWTGRPGAPSPYPAAVPARWRAGGRGHRVGHALPALQGGAVGADGRGEAGLAGQRPAGPALRRRRRRALAVPAGHVVGAGDSPRRHALAAARRPRRRPAGRRPPSGRRPPRRRGWPSRGGTPASWRRSRPARAPRRRPRAAGPAGAVPAGTAPAGTALAGTARAGTAAARAARTRRWPGHPCARRPRRPARARRSVRPGRSARPGPLDRPRPAGPSAPAGVGGRPGAGCSPSRSSSSSRALGRAAWSLAIAVSTRRRRPGSRPSRRACSCTIRYRWTWGGVPAPNGSRPVPANATRPPQAKTSAAGEMPS